MTPILKLAPLALLPLLALAAGAQAPASGKGKPEQAAQTPAQNAVEKLAAMFDSGVMPQAQALLGWHSGRLYRPEDPDFPVAVLLTAQWEQPSAASAQKILLVRREENQSTPRFFDAIYPEQRERLTEALEQRTVASHTYMGHNCFYVRNSNGEADDKLFIRRHGDYLVLKGFSIHSRQPFYGYVTAKQR